MPIFQVLLLCLHLLAAAYWVGGMATMHFAVRPAAVATLAPPLRLPFIAAALARFFTGVTVAVVTLWVSGLGMVMLTGGRMHWTVHAMLALALVMTAVYVRIRLSPWPQLRQAIAASEWPVAAGNSTASATWS